MPNVERQLHLALVAWRALPAVLPKTGTKVGGLETGAWELAQGLKHHAHQRVTFITEHTRAIARTQINEVDLHVSVNRWKDMREDFSKSVDLVPQLRIKRFTWRLLYQFPLLFLTRPWRPPDPRRLAPDPRLANINCDIWACFGVNQDSARIVVTARDQHRPSLLFLESNADLTPTDRVDSDAPNEYGVTAAEIDICLTQASAVVCQSHWQIRQLAAQHGRQGTLIRNPIRLEQWAGQAKPSDGYVLWIGRYDNFHKRPLLALEIARLCPDLPFHMIINGSSPEIEQQVRKTLPANVRLVEYTPYDRMPEVFRKARLFLSTSSASHEGFPNVILQAAASGTPIVSLEDFDDFIESSGAGYCSDGDVPKAAQLVQSAWDSGTQPAPARVAHSLLPFQQTVVAQQVAELAMRVVEG